MSLQLTDTLRLVWNWGNFLHEDTAPRLVDVSKGESLATLRGHTDYVRGALMLGEDRVITWSNDRSMRVWRFDGTCDAVLTGHSDYISSVLPLGDGRLASTSGDDTLRIWSLDDGTSKEISGLGRHLTLTLAQGLHLVVCVDSKAIVLVDYGAGKTIATFPASSQYTQQAHAFDDTSFLISDGQQFTLFAWDTGEMLGAINLEGRTYSDALLRLENGTLLLATASYKRQSQVRFELWDIAKSTKLKQRCIGGGNALSLQLSADGKTVTAQLKDYRRLTLDAMSLQTVKSSGPPALLADGFKRYAPGKAPEKPAPSGLNVTWVDPKRATLAAFHEAVALNTCGLLKDGRCVIGFKTHWRIYEEDFSVFETLSPEAMEATYPDYMRAKYWDQCLFGNRYALAGEAQQMRGLDRDVILAAIQTVEAETKETLKLTPGLDGLFLAHSPRKNLIWRLSPCGKALDIVSDSADSAILRDDLFGDQNGHVMAWTGGGFRPLAHKGQSPLTMHPDAAGQMTHHRLRPNGHLLMRSGTGVCVFDSATGEKLAVLDGGHGMNNWGFHVLQDGPIITWSRTSLRSWDTDTYAPLVELEDPEDWGPGYEGVHALSPEHIVFYAGEFTSDSRIMVWNGRNDLAVYDGHAPEEIVSTSLLKPGVILSQSAAGRSVPPTKVWQLPKQWLA